MELNCLISSAIKAHLLIQFSLVGLRLSRKSPIMNGSRNSKSLKGIYFFFFFLGNQKVKSIIVTEVTVRSPFITYSSQNPWNFLDMEVIMINEDDKCLSPFQLKSIRLTFLQ